ncbi:putative DNA-directed DNA polymerase [Lupinus albus]|uniref:Putative DNA-directed DNA polymerase n=1 Tax=Lupinus albus TaxID=3870 RepID=A0A6A4Q7M5_LUPAL|nr:putative DNA-directed DNA polymerase [Lupinus albus]
MSEMMMRVSDPSKLHLKKELTQIRKAARVLRDPGTTSSLKKSPLTSSRSVALPSSSACHKKNTSSRLDSHFSLEEKDKDKNVFLYNWKNNEQVEEQEEYGSLSLLGSMEDRLSDATNGCDSKSDTYLGIFRCVDAAAAAASAINKKESKKPKPNSPHLDFLNKYQQHSQHNNLNLGSNISTKSKALPFTRDDSDNDTEEYYSNNSEHVRRVFGASPFLLKLKRNNLLRRSTKEDSSYSYSTPALSTSSYNRCLHCYPSTVGSWDATTTSINDRDDANDYHLALPGRQGCGIPCYWSKRTLKHQGACRSSYSPSLSDTLRRKGRSILCGSQNIYPRHYRSPSASHKGKISLGSAQGVIPLLSDSGDVRGGSSIGIGCSDDELSTNFGELDLEGLSRLDGIRWSSSCRSQQGLEIVALNGAGEDDGTPENSWSFSKKYKPILFDEVIGQHIVVQSLINAVSRGRIAPVYLFQGPRGTGKTSTARIFAAALNCVASDESKPCGYCRECADFISGKSNDLLEVYGTNKKGIDRARYLLTRLPIGSSSASSRYTVFVIDECQLLPSKTWLRFLKFLEEPPQQVVIIFITSDLDNVPRTIQSRCQKYLFNKIKDVDIVARLRKISAQENLDIETDALDLIAMNADGSLRDAETMLEQLSLLGKGITTSLVNELVGVVSDEKLLELLELAMSSDTAETVKTARELMDSGIDPVALMSQLADLIMDIIAGSYTVIDAKHDDSFFGGRTLNESELERLKHASKLLSEAEKQLSTSNERSTLFTATLLQLGSMPSPDLTQPGSSRQQSCKTTTEDNPSSASRDVTACEHKSDLQYMPRNSTFPESQHKLVNGNSSHNKDVSSKMDGFWLKSKPSNNLVIDDGSTIVSSDDLMVGNMMLRCINSGKLYDIWERCIGGCHSKTLRQLLHDHGKLVSICEVEGFLVAYVAFGDGHIKRRAKRFLRSITNSMEMVLRHSVEVRMIHLPDGEDENLVNLSGLKQAESTVANEKGQRGHMNGTESCSSFPPLLDGNLQCAFDSSDILAEGNGLRKKRQDNPIQRIESIIREQRLETAWLQVVEKGSPGPLSRLRLEKNQVLPQDGISCIDPKESSVDKTRYSSQHWEDELNNELKMSVKNGKVLQKDQIGRRADRYPMSPSLLHDSSLAISSGKDNVGYESSSGPGGCGFLCWNNSKPRSVVKVTGGTPVGVGVGVGVGKEGNFTLFGECCKPKKKDLRK